MPLRYKEQIYDAMGGGSGLQFLWKVGVTVIGFNALFRISFKRLSPLHY